VKRPLNGAIRVVSDKSLTHRGLILGAIAEGRTVLARPNPGADCNATRRALEALGAAITVDADHILVEGGRARLHEADRVLDLENSGTGIRLLAGVLAGLPFFSVLTGDASLRGRPMERVITPLRRLGAKIEARAGGRAPLAIRGVDDAAWQALPSPLRFELPIASAQVKSALLFSQLTRNAGEITVTEPSPSRDHSERLLRYLGAELLEVEGGVSLRLPASLNARDWEVPGDPSAAAFFWVGAAICAGSTLVTESVGLNPTRIGALDALKRMGAKITVEASAQGGPEPVGRVTVESGPLRAITIQGDEVPRLLDEIPILAVAAARAEGTTWFRDVKELRVKESDRIRTTVALLRALGAEVIEEETAFAVRGPVEFGPARVDSHGDHRIAMSALIADCASDGTVEVDQKEMIATSDPTFVATLARVTGRG